MGWASYSHSTVPHHPSKAGRLQQQGETGQGLHRPWPEQQKRVIIAGRGQERGVGCFPLHSKGASSWAARFDPGGSGGTTGGKAQARHEKGRQVETFGSE